MTQLPVSQSPVGTQPETQPPLATFTPPPIQTAISTFTQTSIPTQISSDYCKQLLNNYQPADGFRTYCDVDYGFALDYPQGWRITGISSSPDTAAYPSTVRRAQRYEVEDMSNYIRTDTYHMYGSLTFRERVEYSIFYNDRAFPDKSYPSLTLGGHTAYAILNCWHQDYSSVMLFFQHGEYYTRLELKAISQAGLDTNWQIARTLQIPGFPPDKNVIPQELIDDSYQLFSCNAPPTPISTPTSIPTPLTPLLPTWTVTPPGASDLDLARHTLLTFFTLLHNGRYAEAVPLYGGSYDGMRGNNPLIPPDDYTALFESSCTNQRPCLLVANIVDEEKVSESEFKFLVEFVWIDGTLYKRGPCCGASETEMPPEWQFPYTVKIIDGQYKVMEEPVLMP
jgi:hypothetical protein